MLLSVIMLPQALSAPQQASDSFLAACRLTSFPVFLTALYSFLEKLLHLQSSHLPQEACHSSVRESYHSSGQSSSHSNESLHDLQ